MKKLVTLTIATAALATACGGSPVQPETVASVDKSATERAMFSEASWEAGGDERVERHKRYVRNRQPVRLATLERDCVGQNRTCAIPNEVAERLCQRGEPDVALAMFRRGSPWRRVYAKATMPAWYINQGAKPRHLQVGEELIVLVNRADLGAGMMASGFGSYDVIRWDGTCVSLINDEVTKTPPQIATTATIPWQRLTQDTRTVLSRDSTITQQNSALQSACRGYAKRSPQCQFAQSELTRVIAAYTRNGGAMPISALIR